MDRENDVETMGKLRCSRIDSGIKPRPDRSLSHSRHVTEADTAGRDEDMALPARSLHVDGNECGNK
jgi:hypothetical protein